MVAHDSGYKRLCHVLQYGSLYRMAVFMLKAQARWWVGSQVIITTIIIIIIKIHLYSTNLYMNIFGCALQYCYINLCFR